MRSHRETLRSILTIVIFFLPFILWLTFRGAAKDWDDSLKEIVEQTEHAKHELARDANSLSEQDTAWGRGISELVEHTNPVLLAGMFVMLLFVLGVFFLLTWIVCLLYLFFGLYLVRERT